MAETFEEPAVGRAVERVVIIDLALSKETLDHIWNSWGVRNPLRKALWNNEALIQFFGGKPIAELPVDKKGNVRNRVKQATDDSKLIATKFIGPRKPRFRKRVKWVKLNETDFAAIKNKPIEA